MNAEIEVKTKVGRPREKKSGVRLNGYLTKQASDVMKLIQSEYGTNRYDIISTALIVYHKIMNGEMPFVQQTKSHKIASPSSHSRSINPLKAMWCEELGGRTEGNMCHFKKYEATLAGTVEAMERSMPLSELPNTKEDFMSYVLGGFESVEEAEAQLNK